MKEETAEKKPDFKKIFDRLFVAGIVAWVLFAWILPAIFNTNNDVTMWMVFLTFILGLYAAGRIVVKIATKLLE